MFLPLQSNAISLLFALLLEGVAKATAELLSFSEFDGSSGLCSPRKLTIYNDRLYIAEAGIGAEETNITNIDDFQCYDFDGVPSCTGATSKISVLDLATTMQSERQDVVVGLFSNRPLSGFGESHASGAHHVAFDDSGEMFVAIGLGLNGTQMVADGVTESVGDFGAIIAGESKRLWASPWIYEFAYDYDG